MSRSEPVSIDDAARLLPWFRVVFGAIGVLSPRRLGRWYGVASSGDGAPDVTLRYASIRAIGLGIGQLTAPPERRRTWDRVALLVDTLDTIVVAHAGLRGRISRRSALTMLSGTVFGLVVGAIAELRRAETQVR